MAPIDRPPPHVAKKLTIVSEQTGLEVEQLWSMQSLATKLAAHPEALRGFLDGLNERQKASLKSHWSFWGRPSQQIPTDDFFCWLILAGRGWGKSLTGGHFCINRARRRKSRGALVGNTVSDVRDVMICGDSGILANSPPDFIPLYEPSKRRLTWPNGSMAICYTADQPNRLRGPNLDWAWCDELAAWRYAQQAWDMLLYCLRKGTSPQVCVTTTPRPISLLKEILAASLDGTGSTIVTRGTTWENYWHLAKAFFDRIVSRNKGALSRQEIFADLLDAVDGALWTHTQIDDLRVIKAPPLVQTYIGVDPAENDGSDNDETGIVAVGKDDRAHGYVLEDWSCKASPAKWARRAYDLFLSLDADAIVCETNRGGKMVAHTIRSVVREGEPRPRIIEVTASRGKLTRAEPIAALYEEGRFHHVGAFARLEDEMCSYVPGVSKRSPDRMDALVWAAIKLFPSRVQI